MTGPEEEGEAEDGGEAEAPEDGADGQPQLDRASSNEPRATDPTATLLDASTKISAFMEDSAVACLSAVISSSSSVAGSSQRS